MYEDRLQINPGSATGAYSTTAKEVNPSFVLMDLDGSKVGGNDVPAAWSARPGSWVGWKGWFMGVVDDRQMSAFSPCVSPRHHVSLDCRMPVMTPHIYTHN